jgi:UDP-N-acetylmuramoyl-tripeptide--D-alanyl-D-alanine ligase
MKEVVAKARFTVRGVLEATGGELLRAGSRKEASGISIDTRTMRRGELYIAIIGKSLDGHKFVTQAVKAGAAGVVVSQEVAVPPRTLAKRGVAVIRVKDTTRALGDIAAFHRKRFSPTVIAVTGSNGKSTVKEMLAQILSKRYNVLKPKSSFNNDIGVPLTVLELTPETQVAVIEMEMNILGGIRRLCEIAQPQIGIVTNIGDTHLEFLLDRAGVAQEKSELIEYINGNGTAILNADDPLVMEIGRRFPTREAVTFGVKHKADIFASRVEDLGLDGLAFRLNGKLPVRLAVPGLHNVTNALAAAGAATAVGMRAAEIVAGLESFKPLPLRLEIEQFAGILLIADCYNANPQSMAAALDILARTGKGRRIAVLGEMFELGAAASDAHREVGRQAAKAANLVLALGEHRREIAEGARSAGMRSKAVLCFEDIKGLAQKLIDTAQSGDTILAKGSRANRMETIVRELKACYGKKD